MLYLPITVPDCNHCAIKWQCLLPLFFLFLTNLYAESCDPSGLARDPKWLALGHYQKDTIGSGYSSFIDSESFFLAKDGKYNPEAELNASIKVLKQKALACKYPARYSWLNSKGCLSEQFLCSNFTDWRDTINAKGITLIFPASFINNPASAFGHTLIRLDESDSPSSALYSYSVNFSARTYGEPGIIYAIKGVFGGYQGYFSIAPYYKLVKKYSDLEKRDIWEYKLNFTQTEIDFLLMHLWELRNVNFSYYYFDENCSYHLLGLFDVMRPELALREKFNFWVIPGDTIKTLFKDKELLKKSVFRPSVGTSFFTKINASTSVVQKQAKKIVDERKISGKEKPEVYDLAYDYLDYLMIANKIPKEESDPLAFKILKNRSKTGSISSAPNALPQGNPLSTHASKKLSFFSGSKDKDFYQQINFKPAYHGLLDPQAGFLKGSAIDFMDTGIRYADTLKLQKLSVLNISSLSTGNYFIKPVSWQLFTGFNREDVEFKEKLIYKNQLYLGKSAAFDNQFFYFLLGPTNKLNTYLHNNHATGGGIKTGMLWYVNERLNLNAEILLNRYWFGDLHTSYQAGFKGLFSLSQDFAFEFNYQYVQEYLDNFHEFRGGVSYYF